MRFVYIGKNRTKQKAVVRIAAIFMCCILFLNFIVSNIGNIGRSFCLGVSGVILDFSIDTLRDSIAPLGYKKYIIEKKTVAESFVDKVNNSISYYAYLKENTKKETLVIYDPNKLKVERESETMDTKDETEQVLNVEQETTKEYVEVSSAGVMKLSKLDYAKYYDMDKLNDFNYLVSKYYVVPKRAAVIPEEMDADKLLSIDLSIDKNPDVPQILIYHTHSMEGFTDSILGNQDTNIVAVGTYLAKILSENYGYNVIHCTESFDYINGVTDRSKAYTYARPVVQQILADNPTIEVVLDIHRDGVDEDMHLCTEVNGKQTAQIMFFNGVSRTSAGGDVEYLPNQNKINNLAMSLQLKLMADKYFEGFARHNFIDAYQYNQDVRARTMLVEVGAQTNSLSEAKNAMEPFAALLDALLTKANEGL